MSKVLMISADSHAAMSPDEYAHWLDPKYHDRIPEQIAFNHEVVSIMFGHAPEGASTEHVDPRDVVETGKAKGLWDPAWHLAELEAEGFVGAVLFPNAPMSMGPYHSNFSLPYPPDYRTAGVWAHNRWLAEFCSHAPGRLLGVGQIEPWPDLNAAVEQIEWARRAGLRVVGMPKWPGLEPNYPQLTDPAWDVVWRACVENDMTVAVHIGHLRKQGIEIDAFRQLDLPKTGNPNNSEDGRVPYDPGRRPLWQLIFSGVFDRFPDLRVSFSELHSEWVEPTLSHLERIFDRTRFSDEGVKMPKLRPTDYWRKHCAVAGQLRPYETGLRHHIGVETVLFGTDYPHSEGTWPNTMEWLRAAMVGVPERDVRLMLGENAARFYGFDTELLAKHVARVGPEISEIMSGPPVSRAVIDNLQWRAAFLGQQHLYDADALDPVIEEDRRLALSA